jgi:hypothetical protein
MADFYDEDKFTLKQDWNWSKIISKGDDLIHDQAYSSACDRMLEYLGIDSEDDLTEEHIKECESLIQYLETPRDQGGIEMDANGYSQTYYAHYRVMQDWIENFNPDEFTFDLDP